MQSKAFPVVGESSINFHPKPANRFLPFSLIFCADQLIKSIDFSIKWFSPSSELHFDFFIDVNFFTHSFIELTFSCVRTAHAFDFVARGKMAKPIPLRRRRFGIQNESSASYSCTRLPPYYPVHLRLCLPRAYGESGGVRVFSLMCARAGLLEHNTTSVARLVFALFLTRLHAATHTRRLKLSSHLRLSVLLLLHLQHNPAHHRHHHPLTPPPLPALASDYSLVCGRATAAVAAPSSPPSSPFTSDCRHLLPHSFIHWLSHLFWSSRLARLLVHIFSLIFNDTWFLLLLPLFILTYFLTTSSSSSSSNRPDRPSLVCLQSQVREITLPAGFSTFWWPL